MPGIEKQTNSIYNENEYLDAFILNSISGSKILSDVAIVDGYAFTIDRSVPKIDKYTGKEEELVYPIVVLGEKVVNISENTVLIPIYATEETHGIDKIEILQEGFVIETVSYESEKEKITFNFTAKHNGTYMVKVYSDLVTKTTFDIMELIPMVNFTPNGSTEYKKQHSVTIKATEGTDKITSIKYQWSNTTAEPKEDTFTETCYNGETITKGEITGQWYLWTLVETESGNKKIEMSEAFNFDNEGPKVTLSVEYDEGDTLSANLSVTAEDNESGIASYTFSYSIIGSSTWSEPINIKSNDTTYTYSFTELDSSNTYAFKVIVSDSLGNETEKLAQYYYIIKNGQLVNTNYVLGSKDSVIEQREDCVYLKLYTPDGYETGIGWKVQGINLYKKMVWNFSNTTRNSGNAWGYIIYCGSNAPTYAKWSNNYGSKNAWGKKEIASNGGGTFTEPKTYTVQYTTESSEGYVAMQTYYRSSGGAFYREYYLYELYLEI